MPICRVSRMRSLRKLRNRRVAGDLHRRAAAPCAANAHAAGMLAAVAEWRRAPRADPAVAAVVSLFLLFKQLAKPRGQLVEVKGPHLRPDLRR